MKRVTFISMLMVLGTTFGQSQGESFHCVYGSITDGVQDWSNGTITVQVVDHFIWDYSVTWDKEGVKSYFNGRDPGMVEAYIDHFTIHLEKGSITFFRDKAEYSDGNYTLKFNNQTCRQL